MERIIGKHTNGGRDPARGQCTQGKVCYRCCGAERFMSGSGGCPGWQLVLSERVSHVHRRIA